jgi:hypothetical protein
MNEEGGRAIDILQLLDNLEDTITGGWPVPGMKRGMVDVDKATGLIESIRAHLPAEIESAREIAAERERLLDEASAEAQHMVENAQRQAAELVQQEGLYRTAERQARALLEQTAEQADRIRAEADAYAVESLQSLEIRLEQTLATVQNGLATLQARTPQDDNE